MMKNNRATRRREIVAARIRSRLERDGRSRSRRRRGGGFSGRFTWWRSFLVGQGTHNSQLYFFPRCLRNGVRRRVDHPCSRGGGEVRSERVNKKEESLPLDSSLHCFVGGFFSRDALNSALDSFRKVARSKRELS